MLHYFLNHLQLLSALQWCSVFFSFSNQAFASTGKKNIESAQIDKFKIGEGEKFLNHYLKKHNLDYKIGSKEYIEFLNSIPFLDEDSDMKNDPKYQIIDAYASVYLDKLDYALLDNPDLESFQLDKSIKNETIQEVRLQNEKKNSDLQENVDNLAKKANSLITPLASSFSTIKSIVLYE